MEKERSLEEEMRIASFAELPSLKARGLPLLLQRFTGLDAKLFGWRAGGQFLNCGKADVAVALHVAALCLLPGGGMILSQSN